MAVGGGDCGRSTLRRVEHPSFHLARRVERGKSVASLDDEDLSSQSPIKVEPTSRATMDLKAQRRDAP